MARRQPWLQMADGLEFELDQLKEEGRAVPGELRTAIEEVIALPDGKEKNDRARELFEQGQALPYVSGKNDEPDSMEEIAAAAQGNGEPVNVIGVDLYDKVYGAWLGRCAGCLLGKPVEGWRTPQLHRFLKATGNYPLQRYMRSDVSEEIRSSLEFPKWLNPFDAKRAFIDQVDCMPEDDDTNYTIIALRLLETYGTGFGPDDVAECWQQNLPILHLCTAERVTYRNLVMGFSASDSAHYCNGYREWIGAQIRADLFGYINPGDPHRAAEMAWRDASISHVKNGIYGEMWVAAMLAQAAVCDDMETIVRTGLAEIPTDSRLHAAVDDVLAWKASGETWDQAAAKISARWDEFNQHHWCHTLSNAQWVTAALVWGEKNLGKTLCLAVMPGFDTDCNAATAGSIVGLIRGAEALPAEWIEPLHDEVISGVDGFGRVKISDMAKRTVSFIGK